MYLAQPGRAASEDGSDFAGRTFASARTVPPDTLRSTARSRTATPAAPVLAYRERLKALPGCTAMPQYPGLATPAPGPPITLRECGLAGKGAVALSTHSRAPKSALHGL